MGNEEYVYQRNIRVIEKFYNSDYYKTLKEAGEKDLVKAIISAIYIDHDIHDKQLYVDLAQKLVVSERPEERIKKINGGYTLSYKTKDSIFSLSSDAVCGWKQLYKLREGDIRWLDDYKAMRKYTAAYFVWPKHKIETINTIRYKIFKDRVDYTLFDISKFFACKEKYKDSSQLKEMVKGQCKLHSAYLNELGTFNWLMSFTDFKDFINKMCLNKFIKENVNTSSYEVFNLDFENDNVILDDISLNYFNENYLENLKNKITNSKR